MTARDIQRRIMVERYSRNTVLPNFTPRGWFEMDVCEITKAGYLVEYEIKLTRSDFRADAAKRKRHWTMQGWLDGKTKHERMGDPVGPSRFYYVAPDGVLTDEDIPEWAGFAIARDYDTSRNDAYKVSVDVFKAAPRLHEIKVDQKIVAQAQECCYWRFVRLFLHGKEQPIVVDQSA